MTTHWTNGYQTEVNYTYGYYKELSPNYQKFCLLLNGIDTPKETEGHTHCELGFGQGVSLNIHAASHLGQFFGTDFNPAHAAHANMLAEQAQTHQRFYDHSFEELLSEDLPLFDSISLHGIWSWISYENQLIILKFIRKFLKPNGVVYISYNCVTGWAANMPIRELFYSYFKFNSTSTNPIQKVKEALEFSEKLLEQKPTFSINNPNALSRLQELKNSNPNYLIHEYLNQDWQCFSFQQIVRLFDEIKLSFAGSIDLNTNLDKINLSEAHQAFLEQIEHPIFKEQCRDYFNNTQFRRDLFIRGKVSLTPSQIQERLRKTPFSLLLAPELHPKTIKGHLGEFDLLLDIYQPLGECFKKAEYQPLTIEEIEKQLPNLNYVKILNALIIWCHLGIAQPCMNQPTEEIIKRSQALNLYILEQASFHHNYQALTNPYSGMGIFTDNITQLLYKAHFMYEMKSVNDLAQFVQNTLSNLGWYILNSKGDAISNTNESLKILKGKAKTFMESDSIKIAKKLRLFY
ncbi:class I SAM-dependent methyltransferase [Acinetobacter equi]|uniref:Methyltransferase regulatory domain protein n=1 Tax=Acinetobacter equi TaxID=1324350 RepID=A0A0N9WDA8_9GAMM|nr:class I SAM-dependent methyltransferase [Acinetobacter equi]ALH95293.1 methyltransferase regulatory domain protein [Acinetobacter equi]